MSGMHRDVRELLQRAEARGWIVRNTANQHLRLEHPAVPSPIIASRRCDARSLANVRAMLIKAEREAGLLAKAPPEPRHQAGESPGEKLQASGGLERQLRALMEDFPEHATPVRMVDGVNLALPIYGAVPPVPLPKWLRQPSDSGESSTGHAPIRSTAIDATRLEAAPRLVIPGRRFVSISDSQAELRTVRAEEVVQAVEAFAQSLGCVLHPIAISRLATKRARAQAARIRGRWRRRDG